MEAKPEKLSNTLKNSVGLPNFIQILNKKTSKNQSINQKSQTVSLIFVVFIKTDGDRFFTPYP
jgi:hypothetical protein